MHPADSKLALLAQDQYGTFADRQARRLGASRALTKRRLDSGAWVRLATGALGFPQWPASFERSIWAGLHAACEESMVAPLSAATLYGVKGFPPRRFEVLVPHGKHHDNPVALVRQTRRMPPRQLVKGFPCPPIEWVVCGLARHVGPTLLGMALDDLLVRRVTTLHRVQQTFLELAQPSWPGLKAMQKTLAPRAGEYVPPRSELERMLDAIIATIPGPPPAHEVQIGDLGELPHQVDRLYVAERVIIEVDGRAWHTRIADFERDRARDRHAQLLGYRVLRYAYEDIRDDPERVRAEIMRALGR